MEVAGLIGPLQHGYHPERSAPSYNFWVQIIQKNSKT